MTASASAVGGSVASISSVAEQNSAATQEVSAAAEEMTVQVEEVTAATHNLGRMADDMKKRVAAFKISSNGNGRRATPDGSSDSGTEVQESDGGAA